MSFEYINLKREKLITNAKSIIDHNIPMVSNLANLSSLIKESFPNTSWAGFYLYDEEKEQLFLGPFQGGMACTIIPLGKGVCGNAAKTLKTQLVPDVNLYPSHIACSSLTKSEVVVPIIDNDKILGVIDLDSEEYANYKAEDVGLLEELASIISIILK